MKAHAGKTKEKKSCRRGRHSEMKKLEFKRFSNLYRFQCPRGTEPGVPGAHLDNRTQEEREKPKAVGARACLKAGEGSGSQRENKG